MDTQRIRTTHAYGEVSENTWGDFDWVKEHEKELLAEYGECTILVFEKKVIGSGETESEAARNAEENLPPDSDLVLTPITYHLAHRHPFFRVKPTDVSSL
ncbi:MAG TPA: hypothetical protein VJZ27_06915 [Aggregatilineales bacterium]|nr:hypothetical protein [Aggregatilineales bacterium]